MLRDYAAEYVPFALGYQYRTREKRGSWGRALLKRQHFWQEDQRSITGLVKLRCIKFAKSEAFNVVLSELLWIAQKCRGAQGSLPRRESDGAALAADPARHVLKGVLDGRVLIGAMKTIPAAGWCSAQNWYKHKQCTASWRSSPTPLGLLSYPRNPLPKHVWVEYVHLHSQFFWRRSKELNWQFTMKTYTNMFKMTNVQLQFLILNKVRT